MWLGGLTNINRQFAPDFEQTARGVKWRALARTAGQEATLAKVSMSYFLETGCG
jgi:hypothetical protein